MAIIDAGSGSPLASGTAVDAGSGSPSTYLVDAGAGSPLFADGVSVAIATPPLGAWYDDGGQIVTLTGSFGDATTFRVRIFDGDGNEYPSTGYAWSCYAGDAYDCTLTYDGRLLFDLPAVTPGVYGVRLWWGAGFGETADTTNTLLVVRRIQSPATFRMASRFPPFWGVGPRLVQDEPKPLY